MPTNLFPSVFPVQSVVTASITANGGVALFSSSGNASIAIQVSGTWTGTLAFETTTDGENWVAITVTKQTGGSTVTTTTTNDVFWVPNPGHQAVRLRATAFSSGTAIIAATGGYGMSTGGGGGGGGGAVTVADGADVAEGATSDAKVVGDNDGTISAKLRGLDYLSALVTDTVNSWLNVSIQNTTLAASGETSTIYNGASALTPKFAKIAASSSGANNLVAAVGGKKIRVVSYNFIANGTVNAKFQSDAAGTPVDLTGLKYCVANMGIAAPYCPTGLFESGSGKTLDLNLSGAVAVGGELTYIEV